MAATSTKPKRLIRGNLRKAILKFTASAGSVLAFNGDHPDFKYDLLAPPLRNQLLKIAIVLEQSLFLDTSILKG
jgi:hypothetical protein